MRPYPTDVTTEEWIKRASELRREDILEVNKLNTEASYDGTFRRKPLHLTASSGINGGHYLVCADTSVSGSFTITLPSDPVNGQLYIVIHSKSGGGQVTIDGNGKNINGSASIILSSAHDTANLAYLAAIDEWMQW